MQPPRRSTRNVAVPAQPSIDANPHLATDDLRRTGKAGLILLTVGCAVCCAGLGLLAFPPLFKKPKPPAETAAKPAPVPADAPAPRPVSAELDSEQLYAHENLLVAGLAAAPAPAPGPDVAAPPKPAPETQAVPAPAPPVPPLTTSVPKPPPGPYRLVTLLAFDDGKGPGLQQGSLTRDPTFEKSPGAWKLEHNKREAICYWRPAADLDGKKLAAFGKRGEGLVVRAQVFCQGVKAATVHCYDAKDKLLASVVLPEGTLKPDAWTALRVPLDEARFMDKDTPPDAAVGQVRFDFAHGPESKETPFLVILDELAVTAGGADADFQADCAARREKVKLAAEKEEKRKAYEQDVTASPDREGFLLSVRHVELARALARPEARAKSIGRLVGGPAAAPDFIAGLALLQGPLKEKDGYVFPAPAPGGWRDPTQARRETEKYILKEHPELLIVAPDMEDLFKNRQHPYEHYAALTCVVDEALKRGALPVLVTPLADLERAPEDLKVFLKSVRKLILELANARTVPVLDATSLLNADALKDKAFLQGRVRDAGYAALNQAFEILYRKLERYAFTREGARPGPDGEKRPEPRKKAAEEE